jgi:anti-sigma regulatory factor (Ser/Thr protein kinase)
VTTEADVIGARRAAERLAVQEGFSRIAAQEVALVTSELAWNLVRHAGGGAIELTIASLAAGPALVVAAIDGGPPIADLETALLDGHTAAGPIPPDQLQRRRGLGSGLGAALRLSDRLVQEPLPRGKQIVATRYLVRPR